MPERSGLLCDGGSPIAVPMLAAAPPPVLFGIFETRRGINNIRMNRELLQIGVLIGGLCVCPTLTRGDVTITEPLGGNDISADKSLNSTNGAGFTALGNIVLTEGATTDFAVGNNKTLILTLPSGWQFNTSAG